MASRRGNRRTAPRDTVPVLLFPGELAAALGVRRDPNGLGAALRLMAITGTVSSPGRTTPPAHGPHHPGTTLDAIRRATGAGTGAVRVHLDAGALDAGADDRGFEEAVGLLAEATALREDGVHAR